MQKILKTYVLIRAIGTNLQEIAKDNWLVGYGDSIGWYLLRQTILDLSNLMADSTGRKLPLLWTLKLSITINKRKHHVNNTYQTETKTEKESIFTA